MGPDPRVHPIPFEACSPPSLEPSLPFSADDADETGIVLSALVPPLLNGGQAVVLGEADGSYRHGRFTCEAIECRQELSALIKLARETIELVG